MGGELLDLSVRRRGPSDSLTWDALLQRSAWLRSGAVFGIYPATIGNHWACAVVGGAGLLVSFASPVFGTISVGPAGMVRPPVPLWLGAIGLAVTCIWAAGGIGHELYRRRGLTLSRALGLQAALLLPESPTLLAWLHRRRFGFVVPSRTVAFSIHADLGWRAPAGLPPEDAKRLWGDQYRHDYDQVLLALRGRSALLASSTYNRHESAETARARGEGWRQDASGSLFAYRVRAYKPRRRAKHQRDMFGGIVTTRAVNTPDAWRTRLFDLAAVPAVTGPNPDPSPAA